MKKMTKAEMQERIFQQVESNFNEQLEILSGLIRIRSLTGQEAEGQNFYAAACAKLGLDVQTVEADAEAIRKHPAYVHIGINYEGRPNIVATKKGTGGGRSLILNGHVDVVSPEPVSQWTVDPWGGEIKGDRLYGRGSLDMKAGLCANLFSLQAILDCGFQTKGDVILESVIEEEAGGSGGTLACLMRGVKADGMVISEPSAETILITHPGIKYFRVTVFGKTAHAALSHLGVNAIVKMVPIIKALEALDEERAKRLSYPLVEKMTGRPCNLCLGKMQAGDWVSTVAGWASLECRLGFVPDESGKEVMAEIERTINEAVRNDSWFVDHPPKIEWFGWDTEPWLEPTDSPFVEAFMATIHKATSTQPALLGSSGGLDNRFGPYFNVPSVSFGPIGANHHGIDEYVSLPSLLTVTKALALFIAEWCHLYKSGTATDCLGKFRGKTPVT